MEKPSKIYVAGHTGLVGSAITKSLTDKGYENLIFRHQSELDLTDQKAVDEFFKSERPEYVFLAAALVGGIIANFKYRADFIYQNIMIQSNVTNACWKHGVKKLLFLGSTCIYPKNAPQPMKESYLLSSPLEYTNEPYAIAKITGLKMCESFNNQYDTNFISVMPTNLYGTGDNFNLERSHVLPALMRKIHLGKCLEENDWQAIRKDLNSFPVEAVDGEAEESVILEILNKYGVVRKKDHVEVGVWGTGTPLREFMYSQDMADACVYLMEKVNIRDIIDLNQSNASDDFHPPQFLNIGTGEEITIGELSNKIKELVGFKGEIVFDKTKPDGTMRKATDTTLLKKLGYRHKYDLDSGLARTYGEYLKLG